MSEHLDLNDQKRDEQLADFTDKLLSKGEAADASLASQDSELRALQETVMLLHEAIAEERPSPGMADRIHTSLVDEWRQAGTGEQQDPDREQEWARGLLRRLGSPFKRPRRRNLAFGFVAVMAVLLLAVVLLSPDIGFDLTATAGMGGLGLPLTLVLVLAGGGIIWWLFRSRK